LNRQDGDRPMAITSILILTTIVAAFVLFGIVLAWGEYQTRHLVRDRKQGREKDGLSNRPKPVFRVKFNQAAKAVETDLTKAAGLARLMASRDRLVDWS